MIMKLKWLLALIGLIVLLIPLAYFFKKPVKPVEKPGQEKLTLENLSIEERIEKNG